MRTKHSFAKKNKQYIYTEADLGEGLLDEGVSVEQANFQKNNTHNKINDGIFVMDMPQSKNCVKEMLNIEEDFSFTYYC